MENDISLILTYIRESRALAVNDTDIARNLLQAGWPIPTLQQAFAEFQKKKVIMSVRGLYKDYTHTADFVVAALNGISELNIYEGEFLAITGQSGSGKSTLLNILGSIDSPTRGEVYLNGKEVSQMSERQKAKYRLKTLSYVFQFFNLLENYTAIENIMFQLQLNGMGYFKAKRKAAEVLNSLGLGERGHQYPAHLSGGQQQRLAIGRAIAKDAPLLFADEPTAHLDTQNAEKVMRLLREVNVNYKKTIILVTHELAYARMTDRIITLGDGRITKIEELKNSQSINWQELRIQMNLPRESEH
jgi:putative ABC transport system ATP-binding protein